MTEEKFYILKMCIAPERKAEIQAHAEAQGESMNEFLNRAITEAVDEDNIYLLRHPAREYVTTAELEPKEHYRDRSGMILRPAP